MCGNGHERGLSAYSVQERRICYPVSQLQEEEEEEVLSLAETADAETAERYSDWWGLERYYEFSTDEEDDQVVDGMVLPQEIAAPAPPQARLPYRACYLPYPPPFFNLFGGDPDGALLTPFFDHWKKGRDWLENNQHRSNMYVPLAD